VDFWGELIEFGDFVGVESFGVLFDSFLSLCELTESSLCLI
jgi:hypothetical protein